MHKTNSIRVWSLIYLIQNSKTWKPSKSLPCFGSFQHIIQSEELPSPAQMLPLCNHYGSTLLQLIFYKITYFHKIWVCHSKMWQSSKSKLRFIRVACLLLTYHNNRLFCIPYHKILLKVNENNKYLKIQKYYTDI